MSWIHFSPAAGFFVIVVLIIARIILLKQKGIQVSPASQKTDGKKILLYLVFILILVMWLFELIKPAFGFSFNLLPKTVTRILVSSLILDVAGIIFIIVAVIFLALTLMHFQQSLRFGLDKNNQGKLIQSGIFSVSRNPFFLSLILYFIGTAFVFPNLFFIGFALLSMVGIHFFILKEERFLKDIYGEEYSRYSRKVYRYLGRN